MAGQHGFQYVNWAKTVFCQPALYFEPADKDGLKKIIQDAISAGKKVKVIGFGHSPSDINCTDEYMISLKKLNRVLEIDSKAKVINVEAGILLKELNPILEGHGLALENLPAVDEVSIGGLLSTGSHNSGMNYGIIATQVLAFDLLKADGQIETFDKAEDVDLFNLAVVGLGALGVITAVKLQCVSSFSLTQVEESCSLEKSMEKLDENIAKSDYFKLLYLPHVDRCINVHIKKTNLKPCRKSSWFWDTLIGFYLYQIVLFLGTVIPSVVPIINKVFYSLMLSARKEESDKSYKILHFNCLFKQYVMEWCVPRHRLPELLFGLRKIIIDLNLKVHLPVEIRFAKADSIALSPCYERETAFMNALMFRPFCYNQPGTEQYFEAYKNLAMSLDGRPHWAKFHGASSTYLRQAYPKMDDFVALKTKMDPDAMFHNDYIKRHIGP